MAQKQTKAKKGIKKEFFDVTAPLITTKISLYASEKEELVGKTIKLDLTKSLRGKSLILNLRIKNADNNLIGVPESIELAGSYIAKVMRKGVDYVEDSFDIECRDCFAKIKPFMLTRKRVSRAILNALRKESKEFLLSQLKIRNVHEIFSDIISNKLQKQLSLKLKKIYPLALCEIRIFNITKKKDNYKDFPIKEQLIKIEDIPVVEDILVEEPVLEKDKSEE